MSNGSIHPRAQAGPAILTRRGFLKAAGLTGAALALPDSLLGLPDSLLRDPYRGPGIASTPLGSPVRIRGRVAALGRGLPGVGVTDGLTVVETAADGTYELVTDGDRPFVGLSLPRGYAIPTHPTGTAHTYRPIQPDGRGEAAVSFDLEPLPDSDENHNCLLLADIQTLDAREMEWFHSQSVPDIQETLRSLGDVHAFGIADGDIMYDDLSLYPEYERGVERMGVPFFQVVGNHDLNLDADTDRASARTFSERFGPRYYSFDRGAVHYVVLDDVFWYGDGYLGYLDADQLRWLENDLARVEAGRPVVVAMHIPCLGGHYARLGQPSPGTAAAVTNREALYRLLEPFQAHILTGHTHESEHVYEQGTHEHVNGAVCGAWWTGPICRDGTPSGYSVYEVRGEEVRWRYKATGMPDDHQMRLYLPGADPSAPREMVANVWNWDPTWSVVWYEDGERRGVMAQRIGLDPLSVELHTGPDLPAGRGWVDPRPARHLFYAPVDPGAREVVVEARDGFGRTFRDSLVLGGG